MEKADAKAVNDILDRLQLFGGIFGPVIPDALATLDGWTWDSGIIRERRILTRGQGPIDLIPAIRPSSQREKGWLMSLGVGFSDPDTELIFRCDNWSFQVSPRLFYLGGSMAPNNAVLWNVTYNPATLLGPLYALAWAPAKFWPYNTGITFQAQHPATALTPTSQVFTAQLGRTYIRDSKQFYESIFVESQRQALGRVQVPIRRGS